MLALNIWAVLSVPKGTLQFDTKGLRCSGSLWEKKRKNTWLKWFYLFWKWATLQPVWKVSGSAQSGSWCCCYVSLGHTDASLVNTVSYFQNVSVTKLLLWAKLKLQLQCFGLLWFTCHFPYALPARWVQFLYLRKRNELEWLVWT